MAGQHKLGEITNLVKNKSPNRCQVIFKINANGEWHNVDWTYEGYYQEEALCRLAIEQGTKELLARLPGTFKAQSTLTCVENTQPANKFLKPGYEGKEFEFGVHPMARSYIRYGHASNCRYFQNWKSFKGVEGIICENLSNLWTVVVII